MAAECQTIGKSYEGDGLPTFRGTYGLWEHYPMLKRSLTSFDDFILEDYFKDEPQKFWYIWGDIFNRVSKARPHIGYS